MIWFNSDEKLFNSLNNQILVIRSYYLWILKDNYKNSINNLMRIIIE